MNTPSHIVIAASVAKAVPTVPMNSAFLLGSVAPDIALYAFSLFGGLYFTKIKNMKLSEAAELMFSDLYFNNRAWIAAHNLLHSPSLLFLFLLPSAFLMQSSALATWLFWFFLSCLLHTAIDIPTHHDDGPLLYFPFEWKTRFMSPVSYWDKKRGAKQFFYLEVALVCVLSGYVLGPLLWRWLFLVKQAAVCM